MTAAKDEDHYSVTVALLSEQGVVRWGSLNSDGDAVHLVVSDSWARDILNATLLYLDTIGSIYTNYTTYQEGLAPVDNSAGDKEEA